MIITTMMSLTEDKIRAIFDELDEDGNGYIDTHKLLTYLRDKGLSEAQAVRSLNTLQVFS